MHIRTKYWPTVGWLVLWVWFQLFPVKCAPERSTCVPIYVSGSVTAIVRSQNGQKENPLSSVGGTVKSKSRSRRKLKRIVLYDSPIYFLCVIISQNWSCLSSSCSGEHEEDCRVHHSPRAVFSILWSTALLCSLLWEPSFPFFGALLHSYVRCSQRAVFSLLYLQF